VRKKSSTRTAYVEPGGRHMSPETGDRGVMIALNDQPPERTAADLPSSFFRSVADASPRSVIALILTGMGTDVAQEGDGRSKRRGRDQ